MLSSWWFDRALRTLVLSHLPQGALERLLLAPLCPATFHPQFCQLLAPLLPPSVGLRLHLCPQPLFSRRPLPPAAVPSPGPHCRADLLPRALSGFDFFSCLCFKSHQAWTDHVCVSRESESGRPEGSSLMEGGPFLSSHPLGENSASMIPAKPRVAGAGSWLPCSPPALTLVSLLRPRLLRCLSRESSVS